METPENTVENPATFERRLESELAWLRALALQLVSDAATADDLVQETVLAALRRRPAVAEDGDARAWLKTVLRSQVKLAWRSARHRAQREERAARGEATPGAAELAARAESQRALSEAVFSLSEPYRSVVLLRYFDGLKPSEVAARRGVPAATVRSQLARAHDELRATLDRRHGGDSRGWCAALLPLAIERTTLSKGAGLLTASLVALLVMKHWIALSLSLLAAAGLLVALRNGDAARPDVETATASPSTRPAPDRTDAFATATLETTERTSVAEEEPPSASTRRGRLRGRVIDKDSSAPLPLFRLDVPREDGEVEELTTDVAGKFESAFEFDAGVLELRLRDVDGEIAAQRLNGSALNWNDARVREVVWNAVDPIEIVVEGSVVIPLRFSPPAGLDYDDFRAELFDLDPLSAPVESVLMSSESVVRGDPPFARFRSLGFLAATRDSKLLRITSRDGLWRGAAWTRHGTAGYEALDVELERAGRLAIELAASDGTRLDLPSLLFRALPDGRILSRDTNELLAAGLAASFDGLTEGEYEVTARARGRKDSARVLHVAPGVETHHAFVLEPLPQTAAIRGELRSRSGEHRDLVTLLLTTPGGPATPQPLTEWIERDGEWVSRFEFSGLAPGRHQLQLLEWGGTNRRWTPEIGWIEAPAENLVFVCDDLTPLRALRFDVVDATTGAALNHAEVEARSGERVLVGGFRGPGAPTTFHITDGLSVEWTVALDGYRQTSGDSAGATLVNGVLVQTVRLERAP
jgi:RNA polymerase sigma-70 factor (ECF subfamily)